MISPRSFYGGDPFGQMRRLQSDMNRLFQSAFTPSAGGFPAMNVFASQDGVTITAEVPGVAEKDLDISVHRDTVTLKGERRDAGGDARAYHRRERGGGRFARTFSLPFSVDPQRVEAEMRNGVLRLTLHRPEADKPRKIQVKAG